VWIIRFVKRILHILIGIALVITTSGITMHYHYCCHQLMAVGLIVPPHSCCDDSDNCCDDVAQTYVLDVDFLGSENQMDFSEIEISIAPSISICSIWDTNTNIVRQSPITVEAEPPPNITSYQVLFQSYLF